MKPIKMSELEVGDIFCHQLKLNVREAFKVEEVNLHYVKCTSRNDIGDHKRIISKQKKGNVILLRKLG